MKKIAIFLFLIAACIPQSFAQKVAQGLLVDYITNTPIKDTATRVELLRLDSSFVAEGWISEQDDARHRHTRTFAAVEVEKEGKYLIRITHPDYHTLYAPISVIFHRREAYIRLEKFALKRRLRTRETQLGEALVKATKLKFYFDRDTLIYNADAFITQEGFALGDILHKMPGVTINDDGEILSNGRKVETLLLNGKDFFNSDRKTLLENLPAFMVKNIKVFHKKKDANAKFERERELEGLVMDVRLKPDYHSSFISRLDLAGGTDSRYYGRALGLKLHDLHRWSVFAGGNNTNHNEELTHNGTFQNLDNGLGQKDFYNAGVNYNIDDRLGRYTLEGKTRMQWSKEDVTLRQVGQLFYRDHDVYQLFSSSNRTKSLNFNTEHSATLFNNTPWAFTLSPSFAHSHSRSEGESLSASFDLNVNPLLGTTWTDSLRAFTLGTTLQRYGINQSNIQTLTPRTHTEAKLSIEKVIEIPHTEDKLTLQASGNYIYNGVENFQLRHIRYVRQSTTQAQHQYQHTWNSLWQWTSKASYLWQWNDLHSLTASASYEHNYDNINDHIYQLQLLQGWIAQSSLSIDQLPNNALLHEAEDPANSKMMREHANNAAFELNYTLKKDPYFLTIRLPLSYQHRTLYFYQQQNDQQVQRHLLRPDVEINFYRWQLGQTGSNFNLKYSLTHQLPLMVYLVQQTNDANPLLIYQGNPDLRNITEQQWSGRYQWVPSMRHNHAITASYTLTNGLVSLAMLYNNKTGVLTTKPQNVDGNAQFRLELESAGFLSPKFTHKLAHHFTFNYAKSVDYSGQTLEELAQTKTVHNYIFMEELTYSFTLPSTKVRGELAPYVQYHRSTATHHDFAPLHATIFGTRVSLFAELPWAMRLQTDLRSVSRRGYNDASMNDNEFIWNATLTKTFSQKFSMSLEGFDLLGQRKNIIRLVNAQSRTETVVNNLRQYVMLHLTWTLNKR